MEKENILKEIRYLTLHRRFKESMQRIEDYKSEYSPDDIIFIEEALIRAYRKEYIEGLKCCQIGLQYNIYNSRIYALMGLMYENLRKSNIAFLLYEHAEFLSSVDKQNIDPPKGLYVKDSDYSQVTLRGLSAIIIANENEEYTEVCIEAIKRYQQRENFEIIVVDYNNFKTKDDEIKLVKAEGEYDLLTAITLGSSKANQDNNLLIIKNNTIVMANTILNLELALYSSNRLSATCAVSNVAEENQKIEVNCGSFKDYIAFSEKNNISGTHTYKEITSFEAFTVIIKKEIAKDLKLDDTANGKEILCLSNEDAVISCGDSFTYTI